MRNKNNKLEKLLRHKIHKMLTNHYVKRSLREQKLCNPIEKNGTLLFDIKNSF